MGLSLAALVFRPDEVSDGHLSRGFAVALAGWDVPRPILNVAPLRALPGWEVAFYESGGSSADALTDEELEHLWELFEDELPPARLVLRAAGAAAKKVYAILYSDDLLLDDAWRFEPTTHLRRFVREGEKGVEIGIEDGDALDLQTIERPEPAVDAEDAEGDDEADEDDDDEFPPENLVRPHRGTMFLTDELRTAALPALAGAFFDVDRRIVIRLVDGDAVAVGAEVARLNAVLKRTPGRGAFTPPDVHGVAAPAVVRAFAQVYDFVDPTDPQDEYRGLAIGNIEGTLRFFRAPDLVRLGGDAGWRPHASAGLYPLGTVTTGARIETVALAADADHLVLASPGRPARTAGPTWSELLRYLSLGFQRRDDDEELFIDALMLRARIRVERDPAG